MNALQFFRADVNDQAVTCDVLTPDPDDAYNQSYTKTDTVDVAVYNSRGMQSVEVEGLDTDTSLLGWIVPDYDSNGNLVEHTSVGDRLEPQNTSKAYDIDDKVGIPNDLDPELWYLGLSKSNQSS